MRQFELLTLRKFERHQDAKSPCARIL